MTIDDKINDEKIEYDINGEVAKISALSSGKINKYECLTGKKIFLSNQKQLNLFIHHLERLLKNKQKPLKTKVKSK